MCPEPEGKAAVKAPGAACGPAGTIIRREVVGASGLFNSLSHFQERSAKVAKKDILFLAALVLFISVFMVGNSFAQVEWKYHSPEELIHYNVYTYPGSEGYFYLPPNYEVNFEANNGKYFLIDYQEWMEDHRVSFDIYFYSPKGELFAKTHCKAANVVYCIPHVPNTLAYETIKVRIVNKRGHNKDFRFVIYDPIGAVKGIPSSDPLQVRFGHP